MSKDARRQFVVVFVDLRRLRRLQPSLSFHLAASSKMMVMVVVASSDASSTSSSSSPALSLLLI